MTEVIVALDVPDRSRALALVDRIGSELEFAKVGLELFTREGPGIVAELKARGLSVFLDLKLHDIPATVAGAVRSAVELDVDLLTLHGSGGRRMLEAAVEAADGRLRLLAVTVLTSLSPAEVDEAWGRHPEQTPTPPEVDVLRLAGMALDSGVAGVVASPLEVAALRARFGPAPLVVTPGIRFPGGGADDQVRIATPASAARSGASHLVVGRAVTSAADPAAALARVLHDVGAEGVKS